MARQGVWQLNRLTVNFCNFSGSSRGVRQFVEELLPTFRSENPQLNVVEALRPGHHPYLKAEYRNGTVRNVGVKNESEEEVLRQAMTLRSSAGRSTHVKVKERHVQPSQGGQRASPSVQGMWSADTHAQHRTA
ncbi:g2125 [Coccomyxa viridis]|uniref:Large ribosomal subunit protein mL43 n=1 Tax=Coccomyxa viridis TaxID=1274662 RepID=A0ABP1FJL8_9CHLO